MTSRACSQAAQALFSGMIDYAGLYPPAELEVREALSNYKTYRAGRDAWILSRFVTSLSQLERVASELSAQSDSAIRPGISFVSRDPVGELGKVLIALPKGGRVEVVEAALPGEANVIQKLNDCEDLLCRIDDPQALTSVFYEVTLSDSWDRDFARLVEAINVKKSSTHRLLGCKLRCGGVEPHMVPPVERLGRAISLCAEAAIPVKFTAGLHQPFRHVSQRSTSEAPVIQTHGYMNVYFASLLAYGKGASREEIAAVIAEDHVLDPEFNDEGMTWLGYRIMTEELIKLRKLSVLSFGSCSFEEPIEAARARGWLYG